MSQGPVYGFPIYDALFKHVLSHESVRGSFFQTFIPFIHVCSSTQLDEHMNPLDEFQILRKKVNSRTTAEVISELRMQQSEVKVHVANSHSEEATEFLLAVLRHFDEVRGCFPKPRFKGTMDFVCELDTGEFALVEMQVVPEEHWNQRVLGCVAGFYAKQLRKTKDSGTAWKELKKVIGINILGGGIETCHHWKDTPDQYVRHYRLQEQLHKEEQQRLLEGIEIIQYSLENVSLHLHSQELQDWLLFFKNAQDMKEEEVHEKVITPAVLEAFELARLRSMPQEVLEGYQREVVLHENISGYLAERVAERKAEGEAKGKVETKQEIAAVERV